MIVQLSKRRPIEFHGAIDKIGNFLFRLSPALSRMAGADAEESLDRLAVEVAGIHAGEDVRISGSR